jgi:hypothetical protein
VLGATFGSEVHDAPADRKVVRGVERVGNTHGHAWVPLDVPDLLEAFDGVDHDVLTVSVDPCLGHLGRAVGHQRRDEARAGLAQQSDEGVGQVHDGIVSHLVRRIAELGVIPKAGGERRLGLLLG